MTHADVSQVRLFTLQSAKAEWRALVDQAKASAFDAAQLQAAGQRLVQLHALMVSTLWLMQGGRRSIVFPCGAFYSR